MLISWVCIINEWCNVFILKHLLFLTIPVNFIKFLTN